MVCVGVDEGFGSEEDEVFLEGLAVDLGFEFEGDGLDEVGVGEGELNFLFGEVELVCIFFDELFEGDG